MCFGKESYGSLHDRLCETSRSSCILESTDLRQAGEWQLHAFRGLSFWIAFCQHVSTVECKILIYASYGLRPQSSECAQPTGNDGLGNIDDEPHKIFLLNQLYLAFGWKGQGDRLEILLLCPQSLAGIGEIVDLCWSLRCQSDGSYQWTPQDAKGCSISAPHLFASTPDYPGSILSKSWSRSFWTYALQSSSDVYDLSKIVCCESKRRLGSRCDLKNARSFQQRHGLLSIASDQATESDHPSLRDTTLSALLICWLVLSWITSCTTNHDHCNQYLEWSFVPSVLNLFEYSLSHK